MPTYEVRNTPAVTNAPEVRGTLIATYPTYRKAFRRWQELNASGRNVYVVRKAD